LADRSVTLRLSANVKGLVTNLKTGQKAIEDLSRGAKAFGPAASEGSLKAAASYLKTGQAAHAAAAKAGLLYDSSGKLTDQFGRLVSEADATKKGLKAVSDEARFAGEHAEKAAEALQGLGKASLAVGTGLVAGFGLAVKTFADFDKAMSSVQAATHESGQNMDRLKQAAIDAGADTAFSAEEAARGIEEMAKAGVSTSAILGGGLKGTLALAAAGALDVGEASEIAASAMTQFGLNGKDIPHIADLLAAGAGKAQGSVRDMGLALSYAGVPAHGLGVSIEQTTGTLALFAKAGITGEKAGTAMRAMLVSMVKPSDQTQKSMDSLGISFSDANGEFIGMDGAAAVLQKQLGGLDEMTRQAALAQIFGNEALGAAQTLYAGGAKGVIDMTAAVDDYNYAAETAAIMQGNLSGDLEKLGGSFDTVLLKSGSGANEVLRGMVQGLEGVVDTVGKIPAPFLSAGASIAGVAGGAALLGGTVITALPKFVEFRESLSSLGPTGERARGALDRLSPSVNRTTRALGGIGKASGIAAVAASGLSIFGQLTTKEVAPEFTDIANALLKVSKAGESAKASDLDSLFSNWTEQFGRETITDLNGIGDAIGRITHPEPNDGINRWADETFAWTGFAKSETTQVDDRLKLVGESLGSLTSDGRTQDAAKAFGVLADQFERNGSSAQDALNHMPAYKSALIDMGNAAGVHVKEQDLLNWALTGMPPAAVAAADAAKVAAGGTSALGDAAAEAVPSLEDVVDALFSLGMINMDARSATAEFEGSLRDAQQTAKDLAAEEKDLAAKGETLGSVLQKNGKDFDLTTEAGSRANEAFQDVAKKGMNAFETKAKEGAGNKELQSSLNGTYEGLKRTANGFGITGTAVDDLARAALGVPDGVDINSWMSDAARRVAQDTKNALDAIPKSVNVNINTNKTTFERLVGLPSTTADGSYGQGLGVLKKATGGPIFGPGTGTSDDIPAWLSNGEHVWTAEEVRKAGGHGAVESLRSMVLKGAPAFATGGRVGWSDRKDDQAAKIASDATSKREALASARWHAQQAYDRIGSGKKDAARKAAAQRALKAAEKREKSAEAAEDRAKEKLRDAKERTARLSESTRDLRTDIRRGDIIDSVMSGSGLSVVDRLRDESRNKDLTVKQRGNLASVAGSSEKKLISLGKQSESLASKLEKAKSKFDDLLSIQSGVASKLSGEQSLSGFLGLMDDKAAAKADANFKKLSASAQSNLDKVSAKLDAAKGKLDAMVQARDSVASGLSGEQSLGSALGQKTAFGYDKPVTSKSLIAGAKAKYTAIRAFAGKLEKLRKMGLSTVILEEVAGLGSEDGAQVADALIKGGSADVRSLNSAYSGIEYRSRLAGDAIAKSMGKHGVAGGQALVKGLESQQASASKALNKLTAPDASGKVTAYGMAMNARSTADRIKKFADKLGKLQKRGLSGQILEEIAGMGTDEGMRAADALLAGSDWSIKELNTQYKRIDTYSQKAGLNVTKGFYDGGVNAAKGLVAGLEDQQGAIEAQMLKIAKGMQTALKKALDINSPSRKIRKLMHFVGDGAVLGLEDSRPAVESAMSAMVTAPVASFGSWSGMPTSGSSVSAPVMELSAADRALMSQFITASQSMPPMNLLVNGRQAGAIVQEGSKAVRTLK
jgi:TP901 family phage tail tape measure protein